MSYNATIGLEVHAELNTKSKMFCGCKNEPHGAEANTFICPVCMAHPGTLPVANEKAIEMVLMFGQSVGATRATYSEFDRKNYFYPDIPKAYQISQYEYPFLEGGELEGIKLTRVHLEEDTARSQHDKGSGSIVDFNRAGVPLMELVTEPVIHDAKTAGQFARELQLLLRTLGISNANMEKGEMRVEANISVSKDDTLGTKVEVKNLNSFKSVESAINYEIDRQVEILNGGGQVSQETRGWDENRNKTFTQRSKETAKDYRYFPDPDLPKIDTHKYGSFNATRLAEIMPEIPSKIRTQYQNLGLTSNQAEVLLANQEINSFYREVTRRVGIDKKDLLKSAANYLTSDVTSILSTSQYSLTDLNVSYFVELMELLAEDKLSSRAGKDILFMLFSSSVGPLAIAEKNGLLQVSDSSSLQPLIDEIIAENESVVMEYKSGKDASLQFLLGQAMKKTKGSANPILIKKLFIEALK
jgi:aspartyl-tRNA(Asn)/glutamyl-tRNA(Gln) amidotransferase subunit B